MKMTIRTLDEVDDDYDGNDEDDNNEDDQDDDDQNECKDYHQIEYDEC